MSIIQTIIYVEVPLMLRRKVRNNVQVAFLFINISRIADSMRKPEWMNEASHRERYEHSFDKWRTHARITFVHFFWQRNNTDLIAKSYWEIRRVQKVLVNYFKYKKYLKNILCTNWILGILEASKYFRNTLITKSTCEILQVQKILETFYVKIGLWKILEARKWLR